MSDFTIHRLNVKLFDELDASQTSEESSVLNIQSISFFSYQVNWSSFSAVTPVITLLATNSLDQDFVQIDSFIPTGTTGGRLVNVEKAGYGFIKAEYTCTSGSGSITISINAKV